MARDLRQHFVSAQFTGRAALEDGSIADFEDGLIHREGAPARVLPDGTRMWYEHGFLHRDGGPAVERPDGGTEHWHRGRPCHAHKGPGNGFTPG